MDTSDIIIHPSEDKLEALKAFLKEVN